VKSNQHAKASTCLTRKKGMSKERMQKKKVLINWAVKWLILGIILQHCLKANRAK